MSNNDDKGINPAAAGIVGAVIGAAAAGAAIVLSDKDNRKKVEKAFKEAKTEGTKRFTQLKKAAEDIKKEASKRFEKVTVIEKDQAVSAKVSKPKAKKA